VSAAVLNRVTLVLAFVGVFIAGVLSIGHAQGLVPPCGAEGNCASVLTSDYAVVFGIPLAYAGLVAYAFLAALAIVRGIKGVAATRSLVGIGYVVAAIGTIGSLILTYISVTQIGTVCYWCLASAATMTLTLIAYALLAQADIGEDAPRRSALVFDGAMAAALLAITVISAGVTSSYLERGAPAKVNSVAIEKVQLVPAKANIHGDPNAPITIVEFADLLCEACQSAYPNILETVEASKGKIRAVFRHLPLEKAVGHQMALPAANIAEIASEKGKFWQFVTAMYQNKKENLQNLDSLFALAKAVGMDVEEVKKRLGDPNDPAFKRMVDDMNVAGELGLYETPTFIVMAPGMKPTAATARTLKDVLESEPVAKILRGETVGN
jgi:protein-disulfide isomerase